MKVRFAGETYDLPPPVAVADEVVVDVASYLPVEIGAHAVGSPAPKAPRLLSLYNLRKVLFFALREGPRLTLAKVRAVLSHRKLNAGRTLVIAKGADAGTGAPVIAFGGQDCPHAGKLCFPRALVGSGSEAAAAAAEAEAEAEGQEELDARALLAWCGANPDIAEALRDWVRFSGRDLPVMLANALVAGRRLLADGVAPAMPKPVSVGFSGPGSPVLSPAPLTTKQRTGLFLAGAGSYPCAYALPDFARASIPFDTVIDLHPARAARVAKRFGFARADTDTGRGLQRLADYETPLLVIATYHSTHVDIAEQALAANPATRIMLEKPPVTTMEQLRRLHDLRQGEAWIEIGYNRRYIPMVAKARERLEGQAGPVTMTCLVKELAIPPAHWYHWPAQGTRITGNLCHWLDLGRVFIPAEPVRMTMIGPGDGASDGDVALVVSYADGSRLNIVATDRGNSLRGVQEYIEIRCGEVTFTVDDFIRMRVQDGATVSVSRRLIRDKGHRRMYARFVANAQDGRPPDYPDADLLTVTRQYLRASAALQTGEPSATFDLTGEQPGPTTKG